MSAARHTSGLEAVESTDIFRIPRRLGSSLLDSSLLHDTSTVREGDTRGFPSISCTDIVGPSNRAPKPEPKRPATGAVAALHGTQEREQ